MAYLLPVLVQPLLAGFFLCDEALHLFLLGFKLQAQRSDLSLQRLLPPLQFPSLPLDLLNCCVASTPSPWPPVPVVPSRSARPPAPGTRLSVQCRGASAETPVPG